MENWILELKEEVIKKQEMQKEHVYEKDANKAFEILAGNKYQTLEDYFVSAAAINLLNTYVKQVNRKESIGYGFKKNVYKLVDAFVKNPCDGVEFKYGRDMNMGILYIQFPNEFTFSFHGINSSDSINKLTGGNCQFDGIRKQMCATTIFNTALKHSSSALC